MRRQRPRVRRWCKGVQEVLASLKPVQNEQDGELSVLKMPVRWIRVVQVLADTAATIHFSVTSRPDWRTA